MLEELKKDVYEANMLLPHYGLVTFTWGNVSGIDREKGLFVIKPSGVDYDVLKPSDMVVMDLEGNKVEGEMNPSSDTATHVELYNAFKEIAALTPPESLATMHDAFVSASGKMDEATTLFKEGLAMDPAAEAEAMQAKLTEASQKYGEALQELQSALMTMGTEAGAATSSEAAASESAA